MKKILLCFLILINLSSLSAIDELKEISAQAGINHIFLNAFLDGGGCAFFDYDNDGFLDIYVTGGQLRDKLYHNKGNGTFEDVGIKAGLRQGNAQPTEGVATADINNDGLEDIYVTSYSGGGDILYKNKGDGTFEDISIKAGIVVHNKWATSVTFGDFNLDGWIDLYITTYGTNTQDITYDKHSLMINNKNETFTDKTAEYGIHGNGYGLSAVATDTDGDNDLDIMVANDFGFLAWPDVLYRNDYPSKTFTDISKSAGVDAGINGMGIGAGDYDEDGDMDYYVTNIGKNLLYRNDGNNKFTDVALSAGVEYGFLSSQKTTTWGPIFYDYDNDTYLDLFFTAGYVGEPNTPFADPNKLFHSNGNGTFSDVTNDYGVGDLSKSRGCAVGDIDNDGLLDLFVVNLESDFETKNTCRLYLNKINSAKNNWFKIKLQGTTSNRDGIGAKVKVYAGGRMFLREIDGGSGHMSHNSKIANYGLSKINKIDSVIVIWPGGFKEKYNTFTPNQQITIVEKTRAMVTSNVNISLCEGEKYDGTPYFLSTKVIANLKSYYGYDSVVTANITVNPKYDKTLNIGICKGETINGIIPTKDTILKFSLKTKLGCDSLVTSNITVNQPSTNQTSIKFCDKGTYDGKVYTTTSTITQKFKNYLGCDSTLTVFINITKSVNGSANLMLCEGEKYKDVEYFSDKTISEIYPSYLGCDSIVALKIKVNPIVRISKDTVILVGQSYNGVKYDKVTQEKFEKKFSKGASNGCDSIFTTNLFVKDPAGIFDDNFYNFELTVSPNPLNNNSEINYYIPLDGMYNLSLYSNTGEKVAEILNENAISGYYKKAINVKSLLLSQGIYICRLTQGSKHQDIKLIYSE
ncbi:MAG: FG-GAP-like repeat-containing protein [Candidatus Kapabacteria bacterium]|nr:FG-GAP-like repeat-containing protein [Candidatus Kapabacteria bacterium]